MKTRNSALYALGLAAAITLGGAASAGAQAKKTTKKHTKTRVKSAVSIPVKKDTPVASKSDTVMVTRVDTVMVRRTDTVTVNTFRTDTVVRMVNPPLAKLPGLFFGLGAGADIPMNDIRGYVKDGYAGQFQIGYFPSESSMFGIRGDATYGQLGARDTDCKTCTSPKLLTGGGDIILRMPIDRTSKLNPVLYIFGGGGYAKFSDVDVRQNPPALNVNFTSTGNLYYDVGPGVDFNLGGLHLYAEGKYMTIRSGTATGKTNGNIHLFPVFGGLKFGY